MGLKRMMLCGRIALLAAVIVVGLASRSGLEMTEYKTCPDANIMRYPQDEKPFNLKGMVMAQYDLLVGGIDPAKGETHWQRFLWWCNEINGDVHAVTVQRAEGGVVNPI